MKKQRHEIFAIKPLRDSVSFGGGSQTTGWAVGVIWYSNRCTPTLG